MNSLSTPFWLAHFAVGAVKSGMEQLSLIAVPRLDGAALWLREPHGAFEYWQRSTPHAEGYLYAERSVRQHCAMWHVFLEYLRCHDRTLRTAQSDTLARFLEGLTAKNGTSAQDSTRRRYLKLLAATFDHLHTIGVRRGTNPWLVLFRYYRPAPVKSPGALAAHEDDRFIAHVLAEVPVGWRALRDQAMLVLIIGSGLYAAEVVGLQLAHVVLEAEPPYLIIEAHGKVPERRAPIIAFARAPLQRWLSCRATLALCGEQTVFVSGKGGPMLPATLYRKVRNILKNTDVGLRPRGGFGPQILRNSFLMRQLARDKPVDVVQQWAGHVELKSTLRYRALVVNPGGIEAE
jgi:integrase